MKSKSRIDKRKYKFNIGLHGGKIWYKNGEPHRERDLPAVILPDAIFWYINGEFIKGSKRQ